MSTDNSLPQTSTSLFRQLHNPQDSEDAWRTFMARYQPVILHWCRRLNLQQADADEVTSDVLLRLAKAMPTFQYDPQQRFRAWLRTVVKHAVSNFWRDRANRPGAQGSGDTNVLQLLDQAGDGVVDELVEQMDVRLQSDFDVAQRATALVRDRVQDHTWQAFWLTAVEGLSGPEAASKLGMPIAHIYVAKKRVGDMLKQAAAEIQQEALV